MRLRPPPALTLLCAVQGCERFAFTAILPLFVLYLHRRHGFTEPTALLIIGLFTALSYASGLPGGMLTDRRLGPRSGLLIGSVLLMLGYATLASDRATLLWPALGLLVSGHGLFRPSMATLLDALFPANHAHRERGFLLLYLAINIAGIAGSLCAERVVVAQRWDRLFAMATVTLLIGTGLLALTASFLPQSRANAPHRIVSAASASRNTERRRAVWLLSALAIVFWLTVLQAGGSLALFADTNTTRSVTVFGRRFAVGPTDFAALHGLLVIALLPLLVWGSAWLRRRNREPSTSIKMVWGYVATAGGFALLAAAGLSGDESARVSPAWLTGCYILLSVAEVFLAPLSMSLVTQLAPPNRAGQAIGLWFAAAAVGNVIAGLLGLLWGRLQHHQYFALLALLSLVAAAVLLSRLRLLDAATDSRSVG